MLENRFALRESTPFRNDSSVANWRVMKRSLVTPSGHYLKQQLTANTAVFQANVKLFADLVLLMVNNI